MGGVPTDGWHSVAAIYSGRTLATWALCPLPVTRLCPPLSLPYFLPRPAPACPSPLQPADREIVHSQNFNRYLTAFRAEWDPKDPAERLIVCGRWAAGGMIACSSNALLRCAVLCRAVLCRAMPHCSLPPAAVLTCTALCCTALFVQVHQRGLWRDSPAPSGPVGCCHRWVNDWVGRCWCYLLPLSSPAQPSPSCLLQAVCSHGPCTAPPISAGALVGELTDPNLATICPVNKPHPRLEVIGGAAQGRAGQGRAGRVYPCFKCVPCT